MPRRHYFTRRHHGHRGQLTIPIAVVLPLVGNVADAWNVGGHTLAGAADQLSQRFTGYSFQGYGFQPSRMAQGLGATLVGLLVHKYVGGALGLNRALGRAKVPLLRI